MIICQEKVILEGLKPFGSFGAINLSGVFCIYYYYPASLIFTIMWGFYLVSHIGNI